MFLSLWDMEAIEAGGEWVEYMREQTQLIETTARLTILQLSSLYHMTPLIIQILRVKVVFPFRRKLPSFS